MDASRVGLAELGFGENDVNSRADSVKSNALVLKCTLSCYLCRVNGGYFLLCRNVITPNLL